jgi:TonB family protein
MLNPWVTIAQPAVPADPLEAVTGNAEPVVDVAQRAAAVKLLNNAQFLSNVRRSAYDLKTRFTSAEGTWQMEDSSPGRNVYRWTVQGPSYSAVNLSLDQVVYSNQPATAIPLRLAQVHSALFAHYPSYGPRATLRMASGNLNGTAVTCVLVSHVFQAQPAAGPRRWEEYESCVDPQTGFLMSYSPAPGLYVAYDYANAQHLGGITVPGKFSISEAGRTVVEAEVLSLTAPAKEDESAYSPAGLNALGVGFPLIPPWHIKQMSFLGKPNLNSPSGQFVVVRGMVSAAGTWTETEVLASSNPSLDQKALERVAKWHQMPQDEQNGATPQSHEAFFIMLFVGN